MYYEPRLEFAYERRGAKWYGFCDKGCAVIVRADKYVFNRAMQEHSERHSGQAVFDLFATPKPANPRGGQPDF